MTRPRPDERKEPVLARVGDVQPEHHQEPASLRHEPRNERMHVRVQLPFSVYIAGSRHQGNDVSVSGFSTRNAVRVDRDQSARCELAFRCPGFRATIPACARPVRTPDGDRGTHFEFTDIGAAEARILRRLIQAQLSGTHLTVEDLAAREDPQTVRDRVKRTVQLPNPAPSMLRFAGTLGIIAALLLVLAAALYERIFVIEPGFAAVTAPAITIYAPTRGELAAHDLDPGDRVTRDQRLLSIVNPEDRAELDLARATLEYNKRLVENLNASLKASGGRRVAVVSGGPTAGSAPVLTDLSPLEAKARIREFESSYEFSKARIRALEARVAASEVFSPCECIVQSIRSGDGDYWVQEDAILATLIESEPEDIKVEALVHLDEISRIETGDRAQLVMPTTGELRRARVAAIQLDSQTIERAGFPRWARQDMSHGSVMLQMSEPLTPSLVGHPVKVRFIDTDTGLGRITVGVIGTLDKGIDAAIASVAGWFGGDVHAANGAGAPSPPLARPQRDSRQQPQSRSIQ
jgi:hypothetical protein